MSTLNLSPEPEQQPITDDNQELAAQARSGASWFYWIAGLSIVNTIIFATGSNWSFFAGLGITQVIDGILDAVAKEADITALKFVGYAIDFVIAGIMLICGLWANKFHNWAFIVGIVLYAIDGVIVLLLGAFFPAGFHALALFFIVRGFLAALKLKPA